MTVALFLILTIAGALAATAAAAFQAPPSIFGGGLALAFIGLAGAAGATASAMRAPDDLTEPRTARGPTSPPPLILPTAWSLITIWLTPPPLPSLSKSSTLTANSFASIPARTSPRSARLT